jgi:hypothetical protein
MSRQNIESTLTSCRVVLLDFGRIKVVNEIQIIFKYKW